MDQGARGSQDQGKQEHERRQRDHGRLDSKQEVGVAAAATVGPSEDAGTL